MKTIYTADHKNIRGCEMITVEQNIDTQERISYMVILDKPYTDDDRCQQVIGLTGNIKEAMEIADNYKTI